ncbi:hypothetical protein CLTEP_12820 [Clostridium tepidiprofundi DSM 19306]|uniref:DUF2920 family protein n=1 Tax=Clostridium tepidiprofundi DSM 19306 TaxID=1121338 RepID=A0A151B583_9CLOT|nr:DUF2920 family protein [Clostridium tepidiprofundi]KYH34817.1 hypothetical protein CLTEP_12820 [Clostridium tepidiprofundi DSM 19306]
MRKNFSDGYNYVTIQCDYFGFEFMQDSNKVTIDLKTMGIEKFLNNEEFIFLNKNGSINVKKIFEISRKYNLPIMCNVELDETLANFNDMGIMQAVDNITAILIVSAILKDNEFNFNENKVVLLGQSHGAYISYLCNAIAPNLISCIIDNSAWIFPKYLINNRLLYQTFDNIRIYKEFSYLAKHIPYDEEILNLSKLYDNYIGDCQVIAFHGTSDFLVSCEEKKNLINKIKGKVHYEEISDQKVDGEIFNSTSHGLGADFFNLFKYAENNIGISTKQNKFQFCEYKKETKLYKYSIDYSSGVPVVNVYKKK